MKRNSSISIVLLLALAVVSCTLRRAGGTTPAPTPPATIAEAPRPTPAPSPSATHPATAEPAAEPVLTAPCAWPEHLWGLGYLPVSLQVRELDERLVGFAADGALVAAVDSYGAESYDESGEALRLRAREAAARAFGEIAGEVEAITPEPGAFWTAGIRFTTAGGAQGEALYTQPGPSDDDYHAYGFLFACPPAGEAILRPELEAMRGAFMPVAVTPLEVPGSDERLLAASSFGLRRFDGPGQEHFVTLHSRGEAGYRQVGQAVLEEVDYLHPTSLRPVQLCGGDPASRLWLEVIGGAGVHSGHYELLSYDFQTLKSRLSHRSASPGAGEAADINGDGTPEVILDETDAYVFCYACSVRYYASRVLRCEDEDLVEVALAPLPDSAPAELRRLNDRAVDLAQAGLWKDAQAAMDEALALGVHDPTLATNAALIRLEAEAFRVQAQESDYPQLTQAFYGDYEAALAPMRVISTEAVWGPNTPLVGGTIAEGWEENLAAWLERVTTQAIEARPELAAAYYLRAWAAHLADPADPQVLADVRRAAELAPEEPLFAEAVAYLKAQ